MLEEVKQLYSAQTVYRERGHYLRRLEQFEQAQAAYNEAFINAPDDVNNLIGRSRVCDDSMQPMQAFADAELALKLQPDNMQARNVQARSLYTMSEFERSIVMNYRGLRKRKQPPYFKEGIIQGLETIQHCIGNHAGHVMLDFFPLIKEQEALRIKQHDTLQSLHKCRIPQQKKRKVLTQTEQRKRLILARVLAMKYLGSMASDKFFLEDLVKDTRIKSANSIGSYEIQTLVRQTLKSLAERQEMLRTQRPYYTVKFAEKTASKYQNKFKLDVLERDRLNSINISERHMKEIEKCLKENRVADLISKAERFQTFLDTKTKKILPEKDMYLDRLYRAVGEAYLSQHRLSYTLSEKSNRRRIAFLMGLAVGRPSSFDSVIAHYPHKFIDVNFAIYRIKDILEMCENSYMRCWLTYEMSRLLCWQKNYALSKFFAKRCQREAQSVGNVTWWLNGCFVLLSGDMQQGNANEVRIQVEEAHAWSKRMQDPEQVQAFLSKCAQMASETGVSSERKAIVQRERNILSVLDEKERVNTEVLFKRMSNVPHGRRFSVMASKSHLHDDKSERRKLKQKGLTVIPGAVKSLAPPPKSDIFGYQRFEF